MNELTPWAHQLLFVEDDKIWSCSQCGLTLRQTEKGVEVITEGWHPIDDHYYGGPPPVPSSIQKAFERISKELKEGK